MGEEIDKNTISDANVHIFKEQLLQETQLLDEWFQKNKFIEDNSHYGFELEGCLVDENMIPALKNKLFLDQVNDSSFVPELAQFNFEINGPIYQRNPHLLKQMQNDLDFFTEKSIKTAQALKLEAIWVGILPTIRDTMLNLQTMTPTNRYFALAERVLAMKKNSKVELTIDRYDHLNIQRDNIMTEAAATSFQIHTQVQQKDSVRAYNSTLNLSGPCIAIMANSPFLYGYKLWDETRIPVFEQSLALPLLQPDSPQPVTLGQDYVQNSLMELFWENVEKHQPILPVQFTSNPEELKHLKFMNGQIWRWIRPIVGINKSGVRHLRLEHRCFPAGPSNIDTIANTAFYLGLFTYFTYIGERLDQHLTFKQCETNFYQCAQFGMKANVDWLNGSINVQELLHDILLPLAIIGLKYLHIQDSDIDYYLNQIMKNRIRTGWTGAAWQKSFIDCHGKDFQLMTKTYIQNQQSKKPVHEWTI